MDLLSFVLASFATVFPSHMYVGTYKSIRLLAATKELEHFVQGAFQSLKRLQERKCDVASSAVIPTQSAYLFLFQVQKLSLFSHDASHGSFFLSSSPFSRHTALISLHS